MRNPIKRPGVLLAASTLLFSPLASAQFTDGIVAYWPFDGDLLDATDTGAHGSFIAGTGDPELRFAPGQFDDGVNLNDFAAGAFDQYVTIDQVAEGTFDFTGGSMTVSAWVSTPFLSISNQTIIAKGTGSSWSLSRNADTSTAAFHGGLSSAAGDPLVHFIDDTLMHHLVGVVQEGVGTRLYLDGQLVASTNGAPQLADNEFFMAIGGNPAAENELFRPWEGVIDDVAIWNRALSAGEVSTLWNNGVGVSIADALNPVDTDEDGMPDFYELTNGLDPNVDDAADDLDGDNLTNFAEFEGGTNPQDPDTDGDDLEDGDEINIHDTDPANPDSDQDGLTDGEEVSGYLNPFLDGVLRDPFVPGVDPGGDPTDPNEADSDGDGFDDNQEMQFSIDPNDPDDSPSRWQVGLKGYWPLDQAGYEASGDDTFPDVSGRGFPGKVAGTSEAPLWFGSPFYPSVVRLNGTDQRIEIQGDPDEFAGAGGDLSVSAWFLTPGWGKNWQAIVAKGEGNSWRVHRNGGNQNVAYAGGRGDISGGGSVGDFKWHHVLAVSQFGIGTRLYVDGEQVATGGGSNLAANGQPMMIGGNPDTAGDDFRTIFGALAEVAVWNRPLSLLDAKTIWNNYNGTSGGATIAELIDETDTDGDGLPDLFESAVGLDQDDPDDAAGDLDEDGLSNLQEFERGTDLNNMDSDRDGLSDGLEDPSLPFVDANQPGTNPLKSDTDGDGFSDSFELENNSDPTNPSSQPTTDPDLLVFWDFNKVDNPDQSRDLTADRAANFQGGAKYSADEGGRTGEPGDYSLDLRTSGSATAHVADATFLNLAASEDIVSISFWQNLVGTGNSSAFWAKSPSSNNQERGIQVHTPWSNGQIYFDTAGCCVAPTQRLQGAPLAGHNWRVWHHFAFVKNGDRKEVWVNGVLTLEQEGSDPLPVDFTQLWIGSNAGTSSLQGSIDDFAIFSRVLDEEKITFLAQGGSPLDVFEPEVPEEETILFTDISVNAANGQASLTWESKPDTVYSVYTSVTLETAGDPAADWTELSTAVQSGGATTTYIDTISETGVRRFYYVVENP